MYKKRHHPQERQIPTIINLRFTGRQPCFTQRVQHSKIPLNGYCYQVVDGRHRCDVRDSPTCNEFAKVLTVCSSGVLKGGLMTTRTPMKIPANKSAKARLTRRKFIGVRMLRLVNTRMISLAKNIYACAAT